VTGAGEIEATTTVPGWLRIPEDLGREARSAWVEESVAELRDAWGEQWDERAAQMVPEMLRASLEERPDAHVVFEVWPLALPARARVQVSMVDRGSLPDWEAIGCDVVPYDGAAVGPGLAVSRQRDSESEDGRLIDWGAVFDDGERALFVQVETVPVLFLQQILAGLHGMVTSLRVTLPDGAPFTARPSGLALQDDDGGWPAARMQAEGLGDSPEGAA
jgi:hypothetical protein